MSLTYQTAADRQVLEAELEAILDNPAFRRAPSLSKLLEYLVVETLAGRGGRLKSFTVYVDGLGKSELDDPSLMGLSRVVMSRLRSALESYYSKNDQSDRLCLYLRAGSYVVKMGVLSVAYPKLRNSDADALAPVLSAPLPIALPKAELQSPQTTSPSTPVGWKWKYLIGAIVLIAAVFTGVAFWQAKVSTQQEQGHTSPIIFVASIKTDNNPELAPLARYLDGVYNSDLKRFKLAKVRMERTASSVDQTPETYRLASELAIKGQSTASLFVSINDTNSNTVIWSKVVELPLDPTKAAPEILPILSEISSSFGVVAQNQIELHRSVNAGGYPCLLKHAEYMRATDPGVGAQLKECLSKPVTEIDLQATMMGIRAIFELEYQPNKMNYDEAVERSLNLARKAVALDPTDAWANFAMARLSYAAGDCMSAKTYTYRTLEANPNHPIFTAVLVNLQPLCGIDSEEKLLDQAILVQSPIYFRSHLLLVQAAIYQNRPEVIDKIQRSQLPETKMQKGYYYAAETLISAAKGRTLEASRNWKLFSDVIGPEAQTADEKMATVIRTPAVRKRAIQYLKDAGVKLN